MIRQGEEIRAILTRACARRELLILATPYLRFESSFLAITGEELHVLATMSREDAVFGLRTPELAIRFPEGLGFFEAGTRMLGLVEGRRTLRLAIPRNLAEKDQRVAYRVERVGRITVTFSTPKANIHLATLLDLSTSGARLHAQEELGEDLEPGAPLALTIPLSEEIYINTSATLRHQRGRSLGLEFTPPLPPDLLEPLSRWVFLCREEERERLARRLEASLAGERSGPRETGGLLLVSADPALEEGLAAAFTAQHPLRRIPPAAQPLKEALGLRPQLVIFHVNGSSLDERRRLKALMEIAGGRFPSLLLGTQVDGATLFEFAGEWKASCAIAWAPQRTAFLQRLVQGIIRRHQDGGEPPLAPSEETP